MKAGKLLNTKFCLIFFSIIFLLFSACGLDVYYYLEAPAGKEISYESADPATRFYSFTTADKSNADSALVGDVSFLGTEIYYKLYSTAGDLDSEKKSINDAGVDNGFDKLLSLGYQRLKSDQEKIPVIPKRNNNQNVEVRIFDETDTYISEIKIDGKKYGKPLRYNEKNFNFSSGNLPQESDSDIDKVPTKNKIYINAYAVSIGTVNNSQRIQSSICPLGSMIKEF